MAETAPNLMSDIELSHQTQADKEVSALEFRHGFFPLLDGGEGLLPECLELCLDSVCGLRRRQWLLLQCIETTGQSLTAEIRKHTAQAMSFGTHLFGIATLNGRHDLVDTAGNGPYHISNQIKVIGRAQRNERLQLLDVEEQGVLRMIQVAGFSRTHSWHSLNC